MHEFLEFIKTDKLGFSLLLILFALLGLGPAHLLRVLKGKRDESDAPSSDSGRLARLEAEHSKRQQDHFRKLHDVAGIVTGLTFKVEEMVKDVADLNRRVAAEEDATAGFRDRLLRVELSATAFARDARAARQFLEQPALPLAKEP